MFVKIPCFKDALNIITNGLRLLAFVYKLEGIQKMISEGAKMIEDAKQN